MNKIVCYTCITGGYDRLIEPLVVSPQIDYVCFADNQQLQSTIWQIRQIPRELSFLSSVKQQRIIKICAHKYLSEYDISIWVDGNITIKQNLIPFVEQYDLNLYSLYVRQHPKRNCIYDEAAECVKLAKDTIEHINPQINRYMIEGYPKNYGLVESNILLRKHNNDKCKLVENTWATEILNGSHRDQLSFNYSCWKTNFKYGILSHEQFITLNRSEFFNWAVQHG